MSIAFEAETLSVTQEGYVARITFTRPELLNRFDEPMHNDFLRAVELLGGPDDIRACVIASTGKVFSAGGDFEFMKKAQADLPFLVHHADVGRRLLMGLLDLPFPVVAAVQGAAIGLGATVALACDLVVASRSAVFADPHVAVGLVAGDGGCLVWPLAIGMARAKRFLLTGDRLSAQDAFDMGMVSELVDTPESALPAAQALATRMASLPPLAVQGTKRALNNIIRNRAAEVVDLAMAYETRSANSDDLLEAIASFQEKRVGSYVGH
jgi:enoyl-CoA hydratase